MRLPGEFKYGAMINRVIIRNSSLLVRYCGEVKNCVHAVQLGCGKIFPAEIYCPGGSAVRHRLTAQTKGNQFMPVLANLATEFQADKAGCTGYQVFHNEMYRKGGICPLIIRMRRSYSSVIRARFFSSVDLPTPLTSVSWSNVVKAPNSSR